MSSVYISCARSRTLAGWQELIGGIANWPIAHLLGIGELRRRYVRSRLGQFWLVASTGITVGALGFVWSILWKTPLEEMLPYGLLLLVVNLAWWAHLIAMACSRFRDLASVVANLLVVGSFVTPVFWQETQTSAEYYSLVRFNPLATLLSLVSDAILGKMPPADSWLTAILLAVLGTFATIVIIGRFRHRIIYWL